jgi:hypothetical protein
VGGVKVTIEGNPASPELGPSVAEATTDANGSFSLHVEPGAYRVVVKPTFDRKLPWSSRRVTVLGDTKLPGPITLSDPRLVEGTLDFRSSDGVIATLASARVEVFRSPKGSRNAAPGTLKLYDAVTDGAGRFRVILPKAASDDAE